MMHALPLAGAYLIDLPKFEDHRGSFTKVFHQEWLESLALPFHLAESYYSISNKHVLRGMHFQLPPHDHEKIVFCSHGSALDVIVDLRMKSATFGQYAQVDLNDKEPKAVYIPKGFAHGFLALSDDCIMHYLVSSVHSPTHDSGILYNSFGMQWPVEGNSLIISNRDLQLKPLANFNNPF